MMFPFDLVISSQVSSAKPAVKKVDPVIFGIMNESDAHIALRDIWIIARGSWHLVLGR